MSQNGKLAYVIELGIHIDKEDFMHDINQYEFKMDDQDKGRGPRGMFQEATQATAWGEQRNRYGSKAGDPRVMESYMLKSVIIQVKKVTCELRWISFLCKLKIQSHQLKVGMLKT